VKFVKGYSIENLSFTAEVPIERPQQVWGATHTLHGGSVGAMDTQTRVRVARRAATILTVTGLVIGLFALPAGADQFTSNNVAPTVTIVNDLPASMDPTEQYTVRVTVHDDNTLGNSDEWGGNSLVFCIRQNGEDCTTGVGTNGSYKKALWTLTQLTNSSTQADPDADNGTWTVDDIDHVAGTYDSTEITLDITFTVGYVARMASDWKLEVITTDEGTYDPTTGTTETGTQLSASDVSAASSNVTAYYALDTPASRDFGNINPNNSSTSHDETVSGIFANTSWNIRLESDSTWTTGGNSISLVTAAPGANEFAMHCQAQATDSNDHLATVNASNYIDSTTTNVRNVSNAVIDFDPIGGDNSVSALDPDTYDGRDRGMRCVIDNGYTRSGTYSGTVTASIGQ